MVVSLLETIFITYLLHLANTQPPSMPGWLYSLLLYCTSPKIFCPIALWKENVGPGLTPTHPPGKRNHTAHTLSTFTTSHFSNHISIPLHG